MKKSLLSNYLCSYRYLFRCLAFIGLFFLIPLELSAAGNDKDLDCSCKKIPWKQAFDKSQHVVFGEVKQIQKHSDELATGDFIPAEVFKGKDTHITKIAGAGKSGASCRKVLHTGFFIAYGDDSHTVVLNNCSASRQLRPEEDLVATLTELKKYADFKAGLTPTDQSKNDIEVKSKSITESEFTQQIESEIMDLYQQAIDWWDSWELF